MKKYTILLLLGLCICFKGCDTDDQIIIEDVEFLEEKPISKFSFELVDANDPFSYKFNNESANFKRVMWSFGDDSTSSMTSPIHTFKKTGKYTVKLIAFNGEDFWAQREEMLEISANDLLKLSAEKQVDGSLNLSFDTDINILKADWIKGTLVSSPIVSRNMIFNVIIPNGIFDYFKLRAYTEKGSMIEYPFMLSELGIVEDFTLFDNNFTVSKDNDGGPTHGEGSTKLIDNLSSTKFYTGNIPSATGLYWQFEYFEPIDINGYAMTSANNLPDRDPTDWQMLGSQDGVNWTVLDRRTGEIFQDRFQTRIFSYSNTTKYKFYRFHITKQRSGSGMQHAEFKMLRLPN
ncbi:MAG: PKD domain-containing protein [Sphingobacterium composti]